LGKYHLCEMTRTVVAVDRQGRLTLPVDVRRRLGIGEGTQLEFKIESNTIRLRRASTIPGEDRWAGLHAGSDCFPSARARRRQGRPRLRVERASARDRELSQASPARRTRRFPKGRATPRSCGVATYLDRRTCPTRSERSNELVELGSLNSDAG